MRIAFQIGRTCVALLLFMTALIGLFPVYIDGLTGLSTAAAEWGHIIAGLAALLLVSALVDARGALGFVLAVAATGLAITPLLRAAVLAGGLSQAADSALGPLPDGITAPSPLVFGELFEPLPSTPEHTAVVFRKVGGEDLTLALYRPSSEGPHDVVVLVAGDWTSPSQRQHAALVTRLLSRGVAVVVPEYRLAPAHPHPAPVRDIRAAFDWVRRDGTAQGLDPERLTLVGLGEGGHLALLLAYGERPAGLQGVVALNPLVDPTAAWTEPSAADRQDRLRALLGGAPEERPGQYAAASVLSMVDDKVAPTVLISSRRDSVIPPTHADALVEKLEAVGADHWSVQMSWAGHGCEASAAGPCGQIIGWVLDRFLSGIAH